MERPSVLFRISSVIFRCQKYVKKGYREMTKKIYLETLKSVLGHSILHYLAVDHSPAFSNTGTTSETFQQSEKQVSFRHILKFI